MIKKILLLTGYGVLVGLLVLGAVNRTEAKTSQNSSYSLGGNNSSPGGNGRGGEGQVDQPASHEKDFPLASYEEHDWISYTGVITGFDSDSLRIQSEGEGILEVTGRAWRFAQESGYLSGIGNLVELDGFMENGEYQVSLIKDLSSGESILLRDQSGRPLWSGGVGR